LFRLTTDEASKTRWMVLIAGVATTFMIWTSLADPINIPKFFILVMLSAWVLGTVVAGFSQDGIRKLSVGQWAILAFALAMILAAVLTDVRYTAFFGTSQRNDGAISYVALAILAIAASMSFDIAHLSQFRNGLLVVGALLTFYGVLQTTGNDPFTWVLVYGPIMGTLGNPDFMSAAIGVSAIATVWMILSTKEMLPRAGTIILLLLELFVLRRSGSLQGLLAFAFGLVVLVLAKLWQLNTRYGVIGIVFVGLCAIPTFLGFVNRGPLASYLFRSTLKNRQDYWHAAIGMFKAHPLVGVGLERFGENYGLYAPQIQVVHGQTTNNAHNVFLQLAATGGLLVILPYLFLIGVIFLTSIRAIRMTRGQAQIDLIAVTAIWIALLLVSLISIDNLGVAVWFWISGGVLYAIAHESLKEDEKKPKERKSSSKKAREVAPRSASYVGPIVSLVLAVLMLIPMISVWKTSAAVFDLQGNRSQLSPAQFLDKMNTVAGIQPKNSQTYYALADIAMRINNPQLALKYLKMVIEKDPKSNYGRQLAAIAYESQNKYQLAIALRVELLTLDPWNTSNMVTLIKDYLKIKDKANATVISSKITELYPSSADAVAAAALIKG
jgi:O-antigen ligase/cytochrome c-type biogenesis protein CcmH/NrfG